MIEEASTNSLRGRFPGWSRSHVSLYFSVFVALSAVGFDLVLQAPLAGLSVTVLALMWLVLALAKSLVNRKSATTRLSKLVVPAVLFATYFASVGCGLLVSHLVYNEAQGLRLHLLQSGAITESARQSAYASFCTSRANGRCGWLNYRIDYFPDSHPQDAVEPGTVVVHQFFSERVSIAIGSGETLERRVVD